VFCCCVFVGFDTADIGCVCVCVCVCVCGGNSALWLRSDCDFRGSFLWVILDADGAQHPAPLGPVVYYRPPVGGVDFVEVGGGFAANRLY
jgi:hypothetical protein